MSKGKPKLNYDERHTLLSFQRLDERYPDTQTWDYTDITREIREHFTPELEKPVNVIAGIRGLREKGLIAP